MENSGAKRLKYQNAADLFGLFFLAILILSGFVIYGAMPAQARRLGIAPGAALRRLWGLTNGEWLALHYKASICLIVSLVPNLYFAWPKREGQPNRFTARFLAGAVAFVSVFGYIAHWAGVGEPDWGEAQERLESSTIDDPLMGFSMQEIQTRMGVPPDHIRQELHLPPEALSNLPMQELMRRYGFRPEDLRHAIVSYGRPAPPPQPPQPPEKQSAP